MFVSPGKRAGFVVGLAAALLAGGFAPAAKAQKPDLVWEKAPSFWTPSNNPGRLFFSPDGQRFAFLSPYLTEVHRTSDQALLYTLPVPNSKLEPPSLSFPDNDTIISRQRINGKGTYRFWRASDGALIKTVVPDPPGESTSDFEYSVERTPLEYTPPFTIKVRRFGEGDVLLTETGVQSSRYAPETRQLAVLKSDGSARILNLPDGSVAREFTAESLGGSEVSKLRDLMISPDGTALVAWKTDGVDLRSAADGSLLRSFPNAFSAEFRNGGQFLVVSTSTNPDTYESRTDVFSRSDGQWTPVLNNLPGTPVQNFIFSPDGTLVITIQDLGEPVRLRRVDTGAILQVFPLGGNGSFTGGVVGISGDDQFVAIDLPVPTNASSSKQDVQTTFWRVSDGRQFDPLEDYRYVTATVFSPDSAVLAGATGRGGIRLWNAADGSLIRTWSGVPGDTRKLAFGADGQTLTATGASGMRTWRVSDGQLLADASAPGALGTVSPDGTRVAAVSADGGTIEIRRAADGSVIRTLHGDGWTLNPLAFAPDGASLVVQSERRDDAGIFSDRFDVFGVADGSILRELTASTNQFVSAVSDGSLLAVTTNPATYDPANPTPLGTFTVYRVSDGTILHTETYDPMTMTVYGANPYTGTYLVSRSTDATVELKNLASGETMQTFPAHGVPSVSITPDRKTLILIRQDISQTHVTFRSVETGQVLREFDREVTHFDPDDTLAFSPDGRWMAYTQNRRVLAVAANPLTTPSLSGDVDASGHVDVSDAILTLRFIVGIETPTDPERRAADLRPDGQVTIADVILILRAALGITG